MNNSSKKALEFAGIEQVSFWRPSAPLKLHKNSFFLYFLSFRQKRCHTKNHAADEETLVKMDMIREELKDFYNFTTGLTYMGNISRVK